MNVPVAVIPLGRCCIGDLAVAAAALGAPVMPRTLRGVSQRSRRAQERVQLAVYLIVVGVIEVRNRELWLVGRLHDARRGFRANNTVGSMLEAVPMADPICCMRAAEVTTTFHTYRITPAAARCAWRFVSERSKETP